MLQRSRRQVILIVDDEPVIRDLLRRFLETDYIVLEAPNGPAALKLLRKCQVDLILLDVVLPGMDGIEVLSRLRGIRSNTPVILVSGAATVPTAVTAMKLGALDCLTKPFT
ncbi:MAG TPA: response regulator, partial [Candidatus Binatia bacterium]|nr:response regulator [Candidatus Binatia bacterium]